MRRELAGVAIASTIACAVAVGGCSGCSKRGDGASEGAPAISSSAGGPEARVVAETLPRCRPDAPRLTIEGDDVVVGDAAIGDGGLLVGLVRRTARGRIASVLQTTLDLADPKTIDLGPAFGDDPPPSPRWRRGKAFAAHVVRSADAGAGVSAGRELRLLRLDDGAAHLEGRIGQQADESLAFDVTLPDDDTQAPIVAWDEDAPVPQGKILPERGVVKVARLATDALAAGAMKAETVSGDAVDAEGPKLAVANDGFWVAWLAKAPDAPVEDAGWSAEAPAEGRALRWVEAVKLDARGQKQGPVHRVSSEKGRAVSFDLVRDGASLVVLVQDEVARAEGGGARLVRYVLEGEHLHESDIVDGGVGQALAELLPTPSVADRRWLAWTDTTERAWLAPLAGTLSLTGVPLAESALDGARVLASAAPDRVFVASMAGPVPELRRFTCR